MAIGNPITLTNNVASKSISVTATADQTLFTVTGGYRINQLAVFRNGVRLVSGSDFTANDGSTVTLVSAANLNDTIEFQVFDDFRVADAIVSAESEQTISGNLTVAGILTATNLSVTDLSLRHLKATGISTVSDTTQSTSTTTGAFIVSGGVGIAKSLFVGGNVSIAGSISYEDVTNVDSVGIITARSHVSIADSILHTGDTDTSIRFPAADTFTVETAGSERVRVGAAGSVGIGTELPAKFLEVAVGNNVSNGILVKGNSSPLIQIDEGSGVSANFALDSNGSYFGPTSNHYQVFRTNSTERVRITSGGDVGINSTSPAAKLDVRGDSFITGILTATSFSDSIGDVRSIPLKTESSSASYTLIASDAGKTIHVHSTTTTVVVPNSVFSAGDAVSIVNGDGSNTPTISQGTGFSLRNTSDGTTGNRTLGVFGMATIYFTGAGVGYISGSGMT